MIGKRWPPSFRCPWAVFLMLHSETACLLWCSPSMWAIGCSTFLYSALLLQMTTWCVMHLHVWDLMQGLWVTLWGCGFAWFCPGCEGLVDLQFQPELGSRSYQGAFPRNQAGIEHDEIHLSGRALVAPWFPPIPPDLSFHWLVVH